MNSNRLTSRLQHLDGLRGLAILLVISFHIFSRWPEYLNFVHYTGNIIPFKYGMHGVQLFFMISGYVIFLSMDNCKNMINFLLKRWTRLFPAMLSCTAFIFLYSVFIHNRPAGTPNLTDAIPGITFIHPQLLNSIFHTTINSLEGAFWTLYVEVFFYIFAGFIFFLMGRKIFMIMLFMMLPLYITGELVAPGAFELLFTCTGLHSFGWFYIGCCVYEIKNNNKNPVIIASLFITLTLNLLSGYILFKDNYGIGNIIFLLILFIIFIGSFYIPAITTTMKNKCLLFFGFISYPLYLIHENLIVALSNSLISSFNLSGYFSITSLIPSICIAILFSYFIAKKIEPYVIRKLRNSYAG